MGRRPPRNILDPFKPYAVTIEQEPAESGDLADVTTIFLTNRECPWRCLMCDLWKNTLVETVPIGAIPAQIDYGLSQVSRTASRGSTRHLKLYNSGSFFDPGAIPVDDYAPIAERARAFGQVTVECHPALVGEMCLEFQGLLHNPRNNGGSTTLEVAMGLETVHPDVLPRLNKKMTLGQFQHAALFLRANGIALRVFVLIKPPFVSDDEAIHWSDRSLNFAFDCGAKVVSLIPTRGGNGAMEALAARGEFSPPRFETIEAAFENGLRLGRGRVFVDLWDLEKFSECRHCFEQRAGRLREMNLRQKILARISCRGCRRAQSGCQRNVSDGN